MLYRFDSVSSISGSKQTENENDDYLPPAVTHGKLQRSATELFNDAYKHFSELNPVASPSRGEPPLDQIMEEVDPWRHAYPDDEELFEDEPRSSPIPSLSSEPSQSSRPARLASQSSLGRMPSFSQSSDWGYTGRGSVSNALSYIPISSPLENAPPPDFSSMLSPSRSRTSYAPKEDTLKEEEEDDEEVSPIPFEQLIHYRDETPTPGPSSQAALRRTSVNPAMRRSSTIPAIPAAQTPPRTPARGAPTSKVDAEEPTSAVRRSSRLRNKMDGLRTNEASGSRSPYPSSSPRKTRRN